MRTDREHGGKARERVAVGVWGQQKRPLLGGQGQGLPTLRQDLARVPHVPSTSHLPRTGRLEQMMKPWESQSRGSSKDAGFYLFN